MDVQNIPGDVQKQVKLLTQWIEEQEHLPDNIDKRLPLRFIHSCYYDLERAKATAKLFFNIRSSVPELLSDRDPLSAPIQKIMKTINLTKYIISGDRNLWVSQINDPGLQNYDQFLEAKLLFLYTDAWLLDDEFLQEADVLIMDVKDVSFKIIMKINFSIMRKVARYQQEAMPLRLKEIHMVNTPPTMDRIYSIMKTFINQELRNMIHFHKPNSMTLLDYFSEEELPEDYGGTRETVADGMNKTLALLMKYRDVLTDGDLWRHEREHTNESIEIKSKENKHENSTETDFRSLAID